VARITPTTEPVQLRAGDTWEWTRSLDEYSAAEWTLKYHLRAVTTLSGTVTLDIVTAADTDSPTDYRATVAPATTSPLAAGEWNWIARVTNKTDATKVFTVDQGKLQVDPNLEAATGAYDDRSHNQKMYDAIVAVLEKRATKGEESYQIGGRMMKHLSPAELEEWKGIYAARVRKEQVKNGQRPARNQVQVRFGPSTPTSKIEPLV
jgi:hypothetical protein